MKKKIIFFLFSLFSILIKQVWSDDIYQTVQPEKSSEVKIDKSLKSGTFKKFVVVTANDYATKIGYDILKKGGTVADAAIAIQLTLGLVEPQSSGLGGGVFLTYYDKNTNKTVSFDGREKAPKILKESIFLNKDGNPKKFFEAVVGGASVGTPSTLKTLYSFHKSYGSLDWSEIIKPVIEFSSNGFFPPERLINAVNKEKYLFSLYPNSIYKSIKTNPKKKFFNNDYTKTLETISKNMQSFYEGRIAQDIVSVVNKSNNPGLLNLDDLKLYMPEKKAALCKKLKNGYKICGPSLPSSGTICIIQALILYEFYEEKLKNNLNELLEILNFVYSIRDDQLADPKFEDVNIEKLLNEKYLVKNYEKFKKLKKKSFIHNFEEVFSSTTHFSLVDKFNNVLSATSSIESSFGSRLFTNGFFLNNQLTDFSFKITNDSGVLIKNRPQAEKKPLSSMSPLIIFDNNENFYMTVGSPGGKAIISYVFKSLVSTLYLNKNIEKAINEPNYIKIKDKIFVETDSLKDMIKQNALKRNLTSGLAIIIKKKKNFDAAADSRRDGTVRGN